MRNLADSTGDDTNINYFFGFIGVASALVFASKDLIIKIKNIIFLLNINYHSNIFKYKIDLGAAYGTAKSGVGICSMGVLKPELIMKSIIPVVMAGILGIYGMIVAVILVQKSIINTNHILTYIIKI